MSENRKTEDCGRLFSIGDTVKMKTTNPNNLRVHRLPGYLMGGTMKVIGFTKNKVKCDWDGGKPFSISPELLQLIESKEKGEANERG